MRIGIDNKIISEEVKDVTNVSEMRKLMSVPGRTDGKERGGAYAWKPGRIILNRNQQKKPIGKGKKVSVCPTCLINKCEFWRRQEEYPRRRNV